MSYNQERVERLLNAYMKICIEQADNTIIDFASPKERVQTVRELLNSNDLNTCIHWDTFQRAVRVATPVVPTFNAVDKWLRKSN